MAVVKTKTVNRTGKSLVKKALVVKAKGQSTITTENIKRQNEKLEAEKKAKLQTLNSKEVEKTEVEKLKEDKKYELTIGLKDLLEAGCHLGHKVSKTHPKAKENIYVAKDGIQIVDLTKTLKALEKACNFVYNAQRNGKKIVLVGTKRQAREVVRRVAMEAGVAYVTDRWLGGTITNWEQIRKDIRKLIEMKDGLAKGKYTESTKKEILEMNKEVIRLEKIIGGLVTLDKMFDIIFVVDPGFEKTAVREAKLRKIKIVAIADTDSDPRKVDFAVPANDDNVKSVSLIVEEIGKAIKAAGVK
ncbi:30S ribosomal protein S2 [Candidatus Shapirobacteria bacterium]|nr:30S ribosomal protein S2 [Candidatus Shapirobacteria bacterium]